MRGLLLRLLLLSSLFAAAPVVAQQVVTSDRTDAVAVTLYRDPQRGQKKPGWPGGYALISETRTIRIPAGRAVIRFQGVSQGMMPETAIVTGLPKGVTEKNRDALLLSPAGLVDAYLKRRVMVRRTDPATGRTIREEAVIEAGPQGGVVLATGHGVEALGCTGLPEALSYARVPDGLFARPTLSVVTDSAAAMTVKVQLSYLAQGFDWSTHYVARVAGDGTTLDLFAWLTVENGGSQGFADAQTQAVAGGLAKEAAAAQPKSPDPSLRLECWPGDVTSTHDRWIIEPLPLPPAPAYWVGSRYGEIIVKPKRRGRKLGMARMLDMPAPPPPPALVVPAPVSAPPAIVAEQEDLGDLKLYRIPERVTVAAQSRKQVAMIDRRKVRFERIHSGVIQNIGAFQPATILLRAENKADSGLGLPLPAGPIAVFETAGDRSLLVGESRLADRTVGDDVEIMIGAGPDVRYAVTALPRTDSRAPYSVRVTNARAHAALFELPLPRDIVDVSDTLGERKGQKIWRVTVPANGEATLAYAFKLAGK